jgi:hypothetical protein
MKPLVTMRQALRDQQLLGGVMQGDSWAIWRALLIAAMGEKLNAKERAIFQSVTGRRRSSIAGRTVATNVYRNWRLIWFVATWR